MIEYLVKKGYNRTEQMLRQESQNLDKEGKPITERVEDLGTAKYSKAFRLLTGWVEQNLDVYKVNLFPRTRSGTILINPHSTSFAASYGPCLSTLISNL